MNAVRFRDENVRLVEGETVMWVRREHCDGAARTENKCAIISCKEMEEGEDA